MSIKPLTSFLSLSLSLSTTREVPKRMETMGAFLDGEWESIFKMFSTDEPDFPCYNAAVNVDDSTMNYPLNVLNSINCSQNESFDLVLANDISLSMDIGAIGVENGGLLPQIFLQHMNENVCTDDPDDCQSGILASPCAELLFKRKCNESECRAAIEENVNSVATQKKKARFCRATQKGKGKKEMEKEDVTCNANNEGATNATPCGQSISCDTSDIESNASQETNGQENSESKEPVTLTLQGKKRASRGAATDPQSLYARRRRMKINERLRILQNLVPNGTKVDISTMLEEAFHYVKFLQLQIKLLSSDELWMFAPIAYNGHDVGLYQRASPFQLL